MSDSLAAITFVAAAWILYHANLVSFEWGVLFLLGMIAMNFAEVGGD